MIDEKEGTCSIVVSTNRVCALYINSSYLKEEESDNKRKGEGEGEEVKLNRRREKKEKLSE